jgi:hypothetical protein
MRNMSAAALKQEIDKELDSLPIEDQRKVLDFTHALIERKTTGVRGQDILPFTLGFSPEDLEIMRQAVEEDCERVEHRPH